MLYQYQEHGVSTGSELFLSTPSKLAEELFFYLHRCGRFVCTPDYKIIRQNFNNYLLFFVEKGRMHIENEGRTYIANEGDMGFINCHLPHAYIALDDPSIFVWVHFSGSNTQNFYEHIVRRSQAVFPLPSKSAVKGKLEQLINLHRKQKRPFEADVSSYLHSMLCELLFISSDNVTKDNMRNPSIEKALRYIRKHYREPIEVLDVARKVNLSLHHFSRLFKLNVGYSPHEYIVLLKLNEAKNLLKSTELSVEQVAFTVGYEYATSFTAVFTRKVGITPKKFRDMLI